MNDTKLIIAYFIFYLLYAGELSAQDTVSATINTSVIVSASATVIGPEIDLETISDIQIDGARRLQEGNEVYINPVFDPEAGIMRASGQPGAEVRLSYLSEMIVTRQEGDGTLLFRYEISGYPGDNQNESELLDTIERVVRFNEDGEFYLWVGGRVDLSDASPGTYEGDFTLEIEYI